jgi:predicted ester cyclase
MNSLGRRGRPAGDGRSSGPALWATSRSALANDTDFGLGGSVWSSDRERAFGVAARINSGTVWVYKHLDVRPDTPFGGAKQSGIGAEMGSRSSPRRPSSTWRNSHSRISERLMARVGSAVSVSNKIAPTLKGERSVTLAPARVSLLEQAERLFTALNAQDLDTAVAMISPSADIRTPTGALTGGKAYREWISGHFRAFPDMYHEIRGIAVESDQTLAFEWRATGTFTAPLATPGGEVPPTGKTIDLAGADFWRFEGGLIVAYHLHFDQLEFLRQLGLAPAG